MLNYKLQNVKLILRVGATLMTSCDDDFRERKKYEHVR